MDTGSTSNSDKLDMLGAALMTASVGHGLLCVATLPGLAAAPHDGVLDGVLKVLGILWTFAGVLSAGYVALQSFSVLKGRDYEKARLAAYGALALPFIGLTGGVTAFALIPIGAAAWWLLRKPTWKAAFAPVPAEEMPTQSLEATAPLAEGDHPQESQEPALH